MSKSIDNSALLKTIDNRTLYKTIQEEVQEEIKDSVSSGVISTLAIADGTVSAPSISFLNDTDTGIYKDSSGINFGVDGVRAFQILNNTTAGFNRSQRPLAIGEGDLTTCSLFQNTSTVGRGSGIFWDGTNGVRVNIASSNLTRLSIDGTAIFSVPIRIPNGAVATPSICFSASLTTGIFSSASNTINIATNGVDRLNISTSAINASVPVLSSFGTNAAPSHSFVGRASQGMYSISASDLGFATGGILRLTVGTAAITPTLPTLAPLGTTGAPSYSFTGRTSTGMYSSAANTINFATNGVNRMTISNTGVSFSAPPSFTSSYVLLRKDSTPQAGTGSALVLTWTSLATSGSDLSFASNVITVNTTGTYMINLTLSGGNSGSGNIITWLEINSSGNPDALYSAQASSIFVWSSSSSAILNLTATNTLRIMTSAPSNFAFNDVNGSGWSVYRLF
jgi:hypothetical protein